MRRLLAGALIGAAFLVSSLSTTHGVMVIAVAATGDVKMFSTEGAAQAHCPRDVVVWLNIPTHVYHEKGMRWYGRTKNGAYVCRNEAEAAGDRDTRNGQ